MKVGSLFTGIGGFDLAFERAGAAIAWQCEIEPTARRVLAERFPGVPCYEDVRRLNGRELPAIDVLCGGFPCQDLSVAGRRAGLAGERSGLFWEFVRLIVECAPTWILLDCGAAFEGSHGRKRCEPCRHGTTAEYSAGCRCDRCREAVLNYQREYTEKRRAAAREVGDAGAVDAVVDAPVPEAAALVVGAVAEAPGGAADAGGDATERPAEAEAPAVAGVDERFAALEALLPPVAAALASLGELRARVEEIEARLDSIGDVMAGLDAIDAGVAVQREAYINLLIEFSRTNGAPEWLLDRIERRLWP